MFFIVKHFLLFSRSGGSFGNKRDHVISEDKSAAQCILLYPKVSDDLPVQQDIFLIGTLKGAVMM